MKEILKRFDIENANITSFVSAEDGSPYSVWRLEVCGKMYVLKKAKNYELEVYSSFFADCDSGAPRFLDSAFVDGENYFLMEYAEGTDLCSCDRDSLKKALDALIALQDKYWENKEKSRDGFSFEKSLAGRQDRGNYLCDKELEAYYAEYLNVYESLPRTLCHDDLLPFNVLVSRTTATIVDWEFAGVLPYLTSIARLLAHCEESEDAFFFMKDEDKAFAVDYYYENLVKNKGISYEKYRQDLDLFWFYEYCEWIMLGNKYPDSADMGRYKCYLEKARKILK